MEAGKALIIAARCRAALLALLFAAAARAQTGPSVTVGVVNYRPVSVFDPGEIKHKWWFWLIIGLIGLFLIVLSYFTWRGFKQWKLHKRQQQQCELEQQEAAAKAGSPTDGSSSEQQRDVEMGRVQVVRVAAAGAGGEQVPVQQQWVGAPQQDAEWLQERARRTGVRPSRAHW